MAMLSLLWWQMLKYLTNLNVRAISPARQGGLLGSCGVREGSQFQSRMWLWKRTAFIPDVAYSYSFHSACVSTSTSSEIGKSWTQLLCWIGEWSLSIFPFSFLLFSLPSWELGLSCSSLYPASISVPGSKLVLRQCSLNQREVNPLVQFSSTHQIFTCYLLWAMFSTKIWGHPGESDKVLAFKRLISERER